MSKRKTEYEIYLNSGHWKALREQAIARDGGKCQHCGTDKNLRVHHLRYRKDPHLVPVGWLLTLCETCHEELHRQKAKERRERRRERKGMSRHARLMVFGDQPEGQVLAAFES